MLPSCARLVAAGSRGIRAAVAEGCGATGRGALLLHCTCAQPSATEAGRVLAHDANGDDQRDDNDGGYQIDKSDYDDAAWRDQW